MSRIPTRLCASMICFPRVSGDEPLSLRSEFIASLFSPRERG